MGGWEPRSRGHYAALGVPPAATPKAIEVAFERWREALRAGSVGRSAYHAAEQAYRALADPASRLRHDRQLGLAAHPAWAPQPGPGARALAGRGLRALGSGRPAHARRLLAAACSARGAPPETGAWLGLAIARSGGCVREALRACAAAARHAPRDAAVRFALAEACAAAGRDGRAALERRRGWLLVARETLRAALAPGRGV